MKLLTEITHREADWGSVLYLRLGKSFQVGLSQEVTQKVWPHGSKVWIRLSVCDYNVFLHSFQARQDHFCLTDLWYHPYCSYRVKGGKGVALGLGSVKSTGLTWCIGLVLPLGTEMNVTYNGTQIGKELSLGRQINIYKKDT